MTLKLKPFNDEVLYTEGDVIAVDTRDIVELKQRAESLPRKRQRICAHRDVSDPLHEMLIVHAKGTYVRPHKHLRKSESLHVIEGEVDVVLFNDDGEITQVVEMGEWGGSRAFYYRLRESIYHSFVIHSPVLVFHEIINGPFSPEATVFAPWAPASDKDAEKSGFVPDLEKRVNEFFKKRGRK